MVMHAGSSTREATALAEAGRPGSPVDRSAAVKSRATIALRVCGEFAEMPGLRLTVPQAARLFGIDPDVAHAVLDELRRASVLNCSKQGAYSLVANSAAGRCAQRPEGDATMADDLGTSRSNGSLTSASADRLTCLLRHWTWADEARVRFEQELTD